MMADTCRMMLIMTTDSPKYLTIREAAPILRVNRDTARRMCAQGRIEATRAGKKWLIRSPIVMIPQPSSASATA